MAAALPFIAVASAGMQMLGTIQQSNAAQAASNANARIAENNAAQIASQTVAAEEKQRREATLRAGAARAAAVSQGRGLSSSTDVLADNAAQEELDILTLRHSGLLQQTAQLQNATLDRANAKATKKALPWQLGTQALNAASAFGQARSNTITINKSTGQVV